MSTTQAEQPGSVRQIFGLVSRPGPEEQDPSSPPLQGIIQELEGLLGSAEAEEKQVARACPLRVGVLCLPHLSLCLR